MTVIKITIDGNMTPEIAERIIQFGIGIDNDFHRDVKWETIEDEELVIPSPVVDQGPYKSEKIAIEVAQRHGWQVIGLDNIEAIMPNGKTAYLLKSIRDWKSVYSWVIDEPVGR